MDQLAVVSQFFLGIGVFFIGIGVLWFVTIYRDIHEKKE